MTAPQALYYVISIKCECSSGSLLCTQHLLFFFLPGGVISSSRPAGVVTASYTLDSSVFKIPLCVAPNTASNSGSLTTASMNGKTDTTKELLQSGRKRKANALPASQTCMSARNKSSKKLKLYEREPFDDPEKEKRRLGAVHQHNNRENKKALFNELWRNLENTTSDRNQILQEKKDLEEKFMKEMNAKDEVIRSLNNEINYLRSEVLTRLLELRQFIGYV